MMGMNGGQRFQLHPYFQSTTSGPLMYLLDTELGETWEFDAASHQWQPIPVQATNAGPAASVQVTKLLQLLGRGVRLVRAVQSSYAWSQQEIDQFEADCRAAGVSVP